MIISRGMQKMFDQVMAEETWAIDSESRNKVLSSSRDMVFYFSTARYYRFFDNKSSLFIISRQRCIEMSTGKLYFDLSELFKKFLALYATRLKEKLSAYVCYIIINSLVIIVRLEPSVGANGDGLSDDEALLICALLNTADYCVTTTR